MTYLQLINEVLKRLRETEITSVDQSDYSTLIGSFINQTKREVEDAHNWIQLRNTIQVTTSDGDYSYSLTGAGNRFRILQVINDTEDIELRKAPYTWMNKQFTMAGDAAAEGSPMFYDINGNDSNGDPYANVYPIPNAIEVINFNLVIPQDNLSTDSEILTVPEWPVILGAYMRAISERGEDGGQSYGEMRNDYISALSDAIGIDSGNVPDEMIWTVN